MWICHLEIQINPVFIKIFNYYLIYWLLIFAIELFFACFNIYKPHNSLKYNHIIFIFISFVEEL